MAGTIAKWTDLGDDSDNDRLRLAASSLALAAVHVEPNLRARHAYEWAMDKRWVGLDPAGRARIAAALLAACGKLAPPPELERLASREALHRRLAGAWRSASPGVWRTAPRQHFAPARSIGAATGWCWRSGPRGLTSSPTRSPAISETSRNGSRSSPRSK
jgi:exopolyphosphatase/guanosine-5'-triphosphate,3'-diphosphate pyrophosphatase